MKGMELYSNSGAFRQFSLLLGDCGTRKPRNFLDVAFNGRILSADVINPASLYTEARNDGKSIPLCKGCQYGTRRERRKPQNGRFQLLGISPISPEENWANRAFVGNLGSSNPAVVISIFFVTGGIFVNPHGDESRYPMRGIGIRSAREGNMGQRRKMHVVCLGGFVGIWLLAGFGSLSYAQEEQWLRQRSDKKCPPAPCPAGEKKPAEAAPEVKPTVPLPPPGEEPTLGPERAGALGGETVALAAPNIIGDLFGAGRSLTFFYERTSGQVFINGTGSTSIVNPKVADNNSPLPEDRVSFRYNYFNSAVSVTGDSGQTVFDPSLGLTRLSQPRFRGLTTTKFFDVRDFTFSGEKTFLGGLASVEVRVPFTHGLSSNLNLDVARVVTIGTDIDNDSNLAIIQTQPTPQNTLGNTDTEFGDMSVILKGLVFQSPQLAVSLGLAMGIPTARDATVNVVDFLGDAFDNDVEIQRLRQFRIHNDTWSLSPFLAVLLTPDRHQRFYAQGFLQFDFPLNTSQVDYSEIALQNSEPAEIVLGSLVTNASLREQMLMLADLSMGYWVLQRPEAQWITGIAPTVELHYTTTLNDAQIVNLPLATRSANLLAVGPGGVPIPEPNPTVGNLKNRVDILDITFGATFVISNRATMAMGWAFPLRGGDDKVFNWEYLLQLNYYFGGMKGGVRPLPPPVLGS
jgi:hypothetical protein